MPINFDINLIRERFPALQQDQVFFDNAGGSQTLGTVINSISDYLSRNNVQLGASYKTSTKSTNLYHQGYQSAAKYINADTSEVVLGASATQLLRNLSFVLPILEGSEIIISVHDHEANIAPWLTLAKLTKSTVKWWSDPSISSGSTDPRLTAENLKPLLTPRTKLVACTHASNILGTITDIKSISDLVHTIPGAMVCVDGVSYAPHRRIDVKALGIDFYVFSWYKVYGPHIAMLYASSSVLPSLTSLGHEFNSSTTLANKIEFAAGSYELVQSLPAVVDYLNSASTGDVFPSIIAHEAELQGVLIDYLNSKPDTYTIYGSNSTDPELRVCTVSFTVKDRSSKEIVEGLESKGSRVGFRWGHFYSKRIVESLLGHDNEGMVRVSMVHYNTLDEIKGFVTELDAYVFGIK